MKTAIKHNLQLLKKINLAYIVLILFIIILWIKNGSGLFIVAIPVITTLTMITIENYDGKLYDTLFSLPITREELAKAKFFTLLISYVTTTLFVLALYFFSVLRGTTKPMETLLLMIELSITLPLSIFLGGLYVGIQRESFGRLILIFAIVMNRTVANVDVDLQLGKDIILDVLVVIILLGLSIASYVGTKRSITDRYLDMEL